MSLNASAIALDRSRSGIPSYDDFHGFRIDTFGGVEGTKRFVAEKIRIGREAITKIRGDGEPNPSSTNAEPLHVQLLPRNALALEAEVTLPQARDLLWLGRLLCLASAAITISGITWAAIQFAG